VIHLDEDRGLRSRTSTREGEGRVPSAVTKIIVAGDVVIDWFQWRTGQQEGYGSPDRDLPNWALYPGIRMAAHKGGAFLLARMVEQATAATVIAQPVPSNQEIETIAPDAMLHSNAFLDAFPYSEHDPDPDRMRFRIREFQGYCRSQGSVAGPFPPRIEDEADAGMVVLDDAGNAFRHGESVWPKILSVAEKDPVVLLKMSRPLCRGELFEFLTAHHARRLVVVINADDLRECGVNISRRLSWERTALDFCWQMENNPSPVVKALAACKNLVVRFGIDGAIHCTGEGERRESRLYYDPKVAEDEFGRSYPGSVQGLTSAFVAALAGRIASGGLDAVGDGVRDGILCSRRLLQLGLGPASGTPDYPVEELFLPSGEIGSIIADVTIPPAGRSGSGQYDGWSILGELTRRQLEEVAYITVEEGPDAVLHRAPVGHFGSLLTVDRTEIESYRSIKNLLKEYLERKETQSPPLSIAVFGPPGSGKSSGITELAKSIGQSRVEKMVFNVAQFESLRDLVSAFHKVRDHVLKGKIPLVFFDEFDAHHQCPLGWLKYFLAPMQDGEFKDGEMMHPIGKSIFVFAGGTCRTFQEFYGEDLPRAAGNGAEPDAFRETFRNAKGTDFVSRLRGYVNIMGVNPSGEDDAFYLIRRAMVLRSILQANASQIFDRNGRARIDRNVLRALIKVPEYKHGARSMVAIIEMSMLADRSRFEQAVLPPREQLGLHVNADLFSRLVLRDVLFGDALDDLAEKIHTRYQRELLQSGGIAKDSWRAQPWGELSEECRELVREQAAHIPAKLERIGCCFTPYAGRGDGAFHFGRPEVEILAREEHERWVWSMTARGWRYGPERDEAMKTHPNLTGWDALPPVEKELGEQAVMLIPEILADAGFEIYRL
jgi:hypothetical protein